jgi:hypothetical protein
LQANRGSSRKPTDDTNDCSTARRIAFAEFSFGKADAESIEMSARTPEGTFEAAAFTAVRQSIFEPVTKNGQPIAQRALMCVDFKLPEA